MTRTSYKTKQEVIDAIKEMREYPRWSEKTSYAQTAEEVVDEADRVCTEHALPCWSWNTVAKVAKHMVRKNEGAARVPVLLINSSALPPARWRGSTERNYHASYRMVSL